MKKFMVEYSLGTDASDYHFVEAKTQEEADMIAYTMARELFEDQARYGATEVTDENREELEDLL